MGSSFLNHDTKDQRTDIKEKEREKKKKPRTNCKLAQKYIEITILYDALTISTHDACSNAVRISSIAL